MHMCTFVNATVRHDNILHGNKRYLTTTLTKLVLLITTNVKTKICHIEESSNKSWLIDSHSPDLTAGLNDLCVQLQSSREKTRAEQKTDISVHDAHINTARKSNKEVEKGPVFCPAVWCRVSGSCINLYECEGQTCRRGFSGYRVKQTFAGHVM